MPASNVEIVVPTTADGQGILALARGVQLFETHDVDTIEELWTEFVTKGDEKSWYHFLIARREGRVLGFGCYGRRPLTEGTFDLYWIGVAQEAHGQGIGKVLLKEVEERVRGLGGRLLIAETAGRPEFEPTRRFYLSTGYELEARLRDFYQPGDDLVIFTKHF